MARPITGTRKLHAFTPTENGHLHAKSYSFSTEVFHHQICNADELTAENARYKNEEQYFESFIL